ncbi:MAG: D-mannonate dehydratase, partial [Spirochaetia bacterium]
MKLGIGLYRHMLVPENYRFARQIGCTHIVAHLVDYSRKDDQPIDATGGGWGVAGGAGAGW